MVHGRTSIVGQTVREKPIWRGNSVKFEDQCCMEVQAWEMVPGGAIKKRKGSERWSSEERERSSRG
jgi:hypothetical protein